MRTVRVLISGRVQGVGFRYWTEATATGLGLDGWVRNRREGAVEAVFQGDGPSVGAMIQACHNGPRFARVERVQVFEGAAASEPGFRLLPTV